MNRHPNPPWSLRPLLAVAGLCLAAAFAAEARTVRMAIVAGHNEASLTLFESVGFQSWGRLPGVVHMPEGRRDIVILGLEVDLSVGGGAWPAAALP